MCHTMQQNMISNKNIMHLDFLFMHNQDEKGNSISLRDERSNESWNMTQ